MDNYKASLGTAARARDFARDIENAVNDAGLSRDDWAGDVSDVGNYANWCSAATNGFTSDAAFAAAEFGFVEEAGGDRDALLLSELDGSFVGDGILSGEDFHDGMFNIFHDDDDDDSWDSNDWDSNEQDYY